MGKTAGNHNPSPKYWKGVFNSISSHIPSDAKSGIKNALSGIEKPEDFKGKGKEAERWAIRYAESTGGLPGIILKGLVKGVFFLGAEKLIDLFKSGYDKVKSWVMAFWEKAKGAWDSFTGFLGFGDKTARGMADELIKLIAGLIIVVIVIGFAAIIRWLEYQIAMMSTLAILKILGGVLLGLALAFGMAVFVKNMTRILKRRGHAKEGWNQMISQLGTWVNTFKKDGATFITSFWMFSGENATKPGIKKTRGDWKINDVETSSGSTYLYLVEEHPNREFDRGHFRIQHGKQTVFWVDPRGNRFQVVQIHTM